MGVLIGLLPFYLLNQFCEALHFNADGNTKKFTVEVEIEKYIGKVITMKYISLSEIATYQQGKQISIDLQYDSPSVGLGRFVRIVDYMNKSEPPRYVKDVDTKYHVNEEDLVMIRYGSQTAGSVVRGISGIIANNLFQIKLKSNAFDKSFMYYYLSSSNVKKQLMGGQSSSTMPAITFGMMKNIMIPVFDLADQKRIAGLLDLLSEKIRINKEVNENLLQQARALYQSWFVDYEPFSGDRPSDWIDGTIDDLAKEIICGKTPSTKVSEYYGNDIPFITIPDMHGNTYAVTTERYLSSYGAESQRKKTLPYNSICVSCIGTAGLVTLTAQESQTNQQINSIIPKEGYSPYYIYLLMETLSVIINKFGQGGSTIVNLNKAQFGKISVIIPTVVTMKSFDEIVSPMFESILSNQKENVKLTELRDALLPHLMSGKLNVSELEL